MKKEILKALILTGSYRHEFEGNGVLTIKYSKISTLLETEDKRTVKCLTVGYICQDGTKVDDITEGVIKRSLVTHDGVAYMFNNNTSLQLIRCKIPDDKFKITERLDVMYSDYNSKGSNSELYPLEDLDEVVTIFVNRLQSVDPSISIVKGL